jgi:hypothetical protein
VALLRYCGGHATVTPSTWPAIPGGRVRLSGAAAELAKSVTGAAAGGVAAAGGSSGLHEAFVVGGSAEVVDVLLGDDDGELGMHGWTSFRGVVRAL